MSSYKQIAPFSYAKKTGWWHVSFCKLSQLLLPTFLRKKRMIAWLCVLTHPISTLYSDWLKNRRNNLYIVEHNSQVCYLRKVLNDEFDRALRRIIITDGLNLDAFYIYTEGEGKPQWLHTESENNPIYLHPSSAYAGAVDFYVVVPSDLIFDENKMRALIDFYRLASKRYEIVVQ